jgi:hypothetical protein
MSDSGTCRIAARDCFFFYKKIHRRFPYSFAFLLCFHSASTFSQRSWPLSASMSVRLIFLCCSQLMRTAILPSLAHCIPCPASDHRDTTGVCLCLHREGRPLESAVSNRFNTASYFWRIGGLISMSWKFFFENQERVFWSLFLPESFNEDHDLAPFTSLEGIYIIYTWYIEYIYHIYVIY